MSNNPIRQTTSTEIGITDSFDGRISQLIDTDNRHRDVLVLLVISYTWTLVLTGVPLAFQVGPLDYYENHPRWYTGDDVIRLLEPIGGLILNFFVFYKSGVFNKELDFMSGKWVVLFFFGAALYEQGAGFHSASNMFKNGLQTIDYDDRDMHDMYYWMRTVWEHIVSHYMYAVGYAIMTGVQCYCYKDFKAPQAGLSVRLKALLVCASLVFSALIAGVAADFPSGIIVALIYLVLCGFGLVGGFVYYVYKYQGDRTALVFGSRPVLHHFLLSYVLAFVFILIYVASVGGIKSRSEAGL